MKINAANPRIVRRQRGFTLPEVLTASVLLMLLTGGIIYTFMFGLHLHRTAEIKLGANDAARKAVIAITDEIRSATRIQIGTGSQTNFTEVATNVLQVGPALQIYPSTATNNWIRYYCINDSGYTNQSRLCRTTSASGTNFTFVVSHALTNSASLFSCEDSYGAPLNNNLNNRVIGMNLKIFQSKFNVMQNAQAANGDYYQLRTRVTRRRLY